MRSFLIAIIMVFSYKIGSAQNLISGQVYLTKSKAYYKLVNISNDTLHLSLKLQDWDFWNSPVYSDDYFYRGDTLFIRLDNYQAEGPLHFPEAVVAHIEGARFHTIISPNGVFSFYLRVKDIAAKFSGINYLVLINHNNHIPIALIRTKKRFRLTNEPINFGKH